MRPRCYLLSLAILSLLQAARSSTGTEADEQLMAKMNNDNFETSKDIWEDNNSLPNPLPPSLLLQLLQYETLLEQPSSPPSHTNDDDSDNSEVSNNADSNINGVTKRVFCNGFTGCGGKHRRRRIYGKRLFLVKPPLCNDYGCFNGKRTTLKNRGRALTLAQLRARGFVKARARGGKGGVEDKGKRLFCNGYGGCRGGKRSLFSPWMSKMNSIADSLR